MGLFDTFDDSVTLAVRNDDKPGLYWQRVDDVAVEKTRTGNREYLKIYKTTLKVIVSRDQQAHPAGAETTQAFFRDNYSYMERDLKKIMKAAFELSDEEANELTGAKIKEYMIDEKRLNGIVLEVSAHQVANKKKPGEFFTQVTVKRSVGEEELKAGLGPETYNAFFPKK